MSRVGGHLETGKHYRKHYRKHYKITTMPCKSLYKKARLHNLQVANEQCLKNIKKMMIVSKTLKSSML
jgi:hypothetical protein